MGRKIVLGVLALALAASLSAQQKKAGGAKMALGVDAFPLVKGLIWWDGDKDNSLFAVAANFEYLAAPHFTAGGSADLYFGKASDVDIFYFGLAGHGRWYPLSAGLDRLFIDAGLGVNAFALDGKYDADKGGMTGITISLKAGWKLMFGSKFFVEPSMAYVYAKLPSSASVPTPLGWQPGLAVGMTF